MQLEDSIRNPIFENIWSYEFSNANKLINENKENFKNTSPLKLIDLDILNGYCQFTQHALKSGPACIMQLWTAGKTLTSTLEQSKTKEYQAGIAWSSMLLGLCYFVEGVDKKDAQNKSNLYQKAKALWDESTLLITGDDYFQTHLKMKQAMLIEKCIEDTNEYHFNFPWAHLNELKTALDNAKYRLGKLALSISNDSSIYKETDVKYHYTNARLIALKGEDFSLIKSEMNNAIELANNINSIFFKTSGLMYLCVAIRETVEGLVKIDNTEKKIYELNNQFLEYASQCAAIADAYSLEAIKHRLKNEQDRMHRLLLAKGIIH